MAEHYSFISPWVYGQGTMTPSRLKSLSPMPRRETKTLMSTPQLPKTVQAHAQPESEGMNTIPDPRAATPQPLSGQDPVGPHPDLNEEVSALSTKLINAINHSTMLDDSLQQTRIELEEARKGLLKLEARLLEHDDKLSKGLLMDKIVFDKMEKQLTSEMHEERKRRIDAEAAKRKTDSEVEALTAALFEEANVMVASARKDTEASEKRGEHLRQQLADAEVLQHSLQEQLQDFKNAVEQMTSQIHDHESVTLGTATEPSTPGVANGARLLGATGPNSSVPSTEDVDPDQPLAFSHLIRPILRFDLIAFHEFQDMLKICQRSSSPSSRVSSANYGSLNVLGLGSLTNSSTSSLPGFGVGKPHDSPGTSSSRDSFPSNGLPNLKDERFFKRAIAEDIEPTLRLDLAPGLSWLARRTAINSITAGSLVVEPNPPPSSKWPTLSTPCSLCGEYRKGEEYARKFRFKLSDTEEAQRYPLCDWCMARVRATCDYIVFLRMVAAGHWRAETDEEQNSTWEESVRLRERMFWTRIGGGVVPNLVQLGDGSSSPLLTKDATQTQHVAQDGTNEHIGRVCRSGNDSILPDEHLQESEPTKSIISKHNSQAQASHESELASIDRELASKSGSLNVQSLLPMQQAVAPEAPATSSPSVLTDEEEKHIEEEAEAQLHQEFQKSLNLRKLPATTSFRHKRATSNPLQSVMGHKRNREARLSLVVPSGRMPGAFE